LKEEFGVVSSLLVEVVATTGGPYGEKLGEELDENSELFAVGVGTWCTLESDGEDLSEAFTLMLELPVSPSSLDSPSVIDKSPFPTKQLKVQEVPVSKQAAIGPLYAHCVCVSGAPLGPFLALGPIGAGRFCIAWSFSWPNSRNVPCIPTVSKAFIMKGCWILLKAFSASNEMIMCCYISNFISDFINLDALSLPFAERRSCFRIHSVNVCLFIVEYYAAEKNNDIMKFAGKWMELEDVILNEPKLGCPGTCSVDQAGLELKDLPASGFQVLGLKVVTRSVAYQ
ncbi:hypothetical protein STEG23_036558, partial [Scotinomys teguina]